MGTKEGLDDSITLVRRLNEAPALRCAPIPLQESRPSATGLVISTAWVLAPPAGRLFPPLQPLAPPLCPTLILCCTMILGASQGVAAEGNVDDTENSHQEQPRAPGCVRHWDFPPVRPAHFHSNHAAWLSNATQGPLLISNPPVRFTRLPIPVSQARETRCRPWNTWVVVRASHGSGVAQASKAPRLRTDDHDGS